MRWDDSVRLVLPPGAAGPVCDDVRRRWKGARFYVPLRAALFNFNEPCGAAERFASEISAAVRGAGFGAAQAEAILLPLAGTRQFIA